MATRIYGVNFDVQETYNGKDANWLKEFSKVVAKDAIDALFKVKAKQEKPYSYVSDETKKKVKVTRSKFQAISVNLLCESD